MYPVDLHMHTVASTHAYSTLHDYIAEAKRKGIKLFAITDHGPDMADARTTGTSLICASGPAW
jgi:putative hydrolase